MEPKDIKIGLTALGQIRIGERLEALALDAFVATTTVAAVSPTSLTMVTLLFLPKGGLTSTISYHIQIR